MRMSPDSRAGSWEQGCSSSQLSYPSKGSVRRPGPRCSGEQSSGCAARGVPADPGTAPCPAAQRRALQHSSYFWISLPHTETLGK